jgi:myo-inositol 2-dehydrogenase/D-chiro-inositol 1-dehydrogenase
MVLDLMIHDFDYARWLAVRSIEFSRAAGEYLQAIIRFQSGAMGLIEGGWAYPPGVFRTALDLSGSEGLIEWSSDQALPIQAHLPTAETSANSVDLPVAELSDDPYTAEIRHAYQAIRADTPFCGGGGGRHGDPEGLPDERSALHDRFSNAVCSFGPSCSKDAQKWGAW